MNFFDFGEVASATIISCPFTNPNSDKETIIFKKM